METCLSVRTWFFLNTPSGVTIKLFRLWGCLCAANPCHLLESDFWILSFSSQGPPALGDETGEHNADCLCSLLSVLPLSNCLLLFPLRVQISAYIQADLLAEESFPGWGNFFSFAAISCFFFLSLYFLYFSFLFPIILLKLMGVFLPLWESDDFARHSVNVLHGLFTCRWIFNVFAEESSAYYSSTIFSISSMAI